MDDTIKAVAYSTTSRNHSIACATILQAPGHVRLAATQRLSTSLPFIYNRKRPLMERNGSSNALCAVVKRDPSYEIASGQRCIEAVRVPIPGQQRLWHRRHLQDFSREICRSTCQDFFNDETPFYISFAAATATSPAECYCCNEICTLVYSPGVVTKIVTAPITLLPTAAPSSVPSAVPTREPSKSPSSAPTSTPSKVRLVFEIALQQETKNRSLYFNT